MSYEVNGAYNDTPVWWPSNDDLRSERDADERRRERRARARQKVSRDASRS